MIDYTSPHMPEVSFTAADVAENRQGRLTPRQVERLRLANEARRHDAYKVTVWFLGFFVVLLVVGGLIEFNRQPANIDQFLARQGPIFIFVGLAMLGMLGVSLVAGYALVANLRNYRISVAEGVADVLVQHAYARGMSYTRYELRLRRGRGVIKLFRLGNERYLTNLERGARYRVYYVAVSQLPIILSAEKIE